MQRFLQLRLGCHGLPIPTGRLAGAGHVHRANRVCLACNSGAIGDEKHMYFECTALAPLRQQHADLFTPRTDTMRSFFAQQDHLGVLNYVIDCLNMHRMTIFVKFFFFFVRAACCVLRVALRTCDMHDL